MFEQTRSQKHQFTPKAGRVYNADLDNSLKEDEQTGQSSEAENNQIDQIIGTDVPLNAREEQMSGELDLKQGWFKPYRAAPAADSAFYGPYFPPCIVREGVQPEEKYVNLIYPK